MEKIRNIFGYLLGSLVFVCGIPALMWLVSGRGWLYWPSCKIQVVFSIILMVVGLALSVYSIIYMKKVGKGNPFDAYNNELAPRTKHLMTDGPYSFSRNPMLLGTYFFDIGILLFLFSLLPFLVFVVEVLLLTIQTKFEEKRLEADFGQEYIDYKKRTGKYLTIKKKEK